MASNYRPQPLRTEHVDLDGQLLELVELLAEHAHDIWARQRIDDGWSYGPARRDELKLHPCLVPYCDLPESEKVYDRNAVIGTVRAMLALGFAIERRGEPVAAHTTVAADGPSPRR